MNFQLYFFSLQKTLKLWIQNKNKNLKRNAKIDEHIKHATLAAIEVKKSLFKKERQISAGRKSRRMCWHFKKFACKLSLIVKKEILFSLWSVVSSSLGISSLGYTNQGYTKTKTVQKNRQWVLHDILCFLLPLPVLFLSFFNVLWG